MILGQSTALWMGGHAAVSSTCFQHARTSQKEQRAAACITQTMGPSGKAAAGCLVLNQQGLAPGLTMHVLSR